MEALQYVELHDSHFHLTGHNLTNKLDTRIRKDMKLEWNQDERMLYVTYKGIICKKPGENIRAMFPLSPEEPKQANHSQIMADANKAQVSTPHGHVFAGPGHGKTK